MKKCIVLAVAAMVLNFSLSFAQPQKQEHQIDKWLTRCIEQDSSTAGMRGCCGKAYDMCDKELNKTYKELMKKLNPAGQKTLKEAQTLWIKYRDAEFKLKDETIGTRQGTMWLNVGDSDRVEFVKQRALELKRYSEILDE
ncbi:MAG: lysozyme inhibitor LprI family protein [Nitrospirota bacterium]